MIKNGYYFKLVKNKKRQKTSKNSQKIVKNSKKQQKTAKNAQFYLKFKFFRLLLVYNLIAFLITLNLIFNFN